MTFFVMSFVLITLIVLPFVLMISFGSLNSASSNPNLCFTLSILTYNTDYLRQLYFSTNCPHSPLLDVTWQSSFPTYPAVPVVLHGDVQVNLLQGDLAIMALVNEVYNLVLVS
jgi:hypothetical protein